MCTHQHPRTAPSELVTGSTYRYWLGMKGTHPAPHVHTHLAWNMRRLLVRFRLGCHDLHICTGRFERPPAPRHARICLVHIQQDASLVAVEDLAHFMLECPAYSYIRAQYLDIFRPAWDTNTLAAGMRAVFLTKHQGRLAICLERMLAHRTTVLSDCMSLDDPARHNFTERTDPISDPLQDSF